MTHLDTLPAAEAMAAISLERIDALSDELERLDASGKDEGFSGASYAEYRALLRLARRAIAAGPVVEARVSYQEYNDCLMPLPGVKHRICKHFLGSHGTEPHSEDCPLVTAGLIDRDGGRLETP